MLVLVGILPLQEVGHEQKKAERVIFSIDHEEKRLTIQTYVYLVQPNPEHSMVLDNMIQFWNAQNGIFELVVRGDHKKITYQIDFDIQLAHGTYSFGGMFIPKGDIPAQYLQAVDIIPESDMPNLHGENGTTSLIGGYCPNHCIYVSDKYVSHPFVGAHELGHRMGFEHGYGGVMARKVRELTNYLSRQSLRDMLAKQDVLKRTFEKEQLLGLASQDLPSNLTFKVKRKK